MVWYECFIYDDLLHGANAEFGFSVPKPAQLHDPLQLD
jgi:hypothetical protein